MGVKCSQKHASGPLPHQFHTSHSFHTWNPARQYVSCPRVVITAEALRDPGEVDATWEGVDSYNVRV